MAVSVEDLRWFDKQFSLITDNIETVIQGKRETIELVTTCLLSGGHALIEDVPGVGKRCLPSHSLGRSTAAFPAFNSRRTSFRLT